MRRLLVEGKGNLFAIVFSIGSLPSPLPILPPLTLNAGYSRPSGLRNSMKSLVKGSNSEPIDICTRGGLSIYRNCLLSDRTRIKD